MDTPSLTLPPDSFAFMGRLFRDWLRGARVEEMRRLLDLVGEELGQRGVELTWRTKERME
jgi:hypothetical protein